MAAQKEISRPGWHGAGGILLLFGCAIGLASVLSYDPNDLGFFHQPPNEPPVNVIGRLGAGFGFFAFMGFGVVGYLLPLALAYLGVRCLIQREGRIWPLSIWSFLLLCAASMLAALGEQAWAGPVARLNSGTPGGVAGELLAARLLVPWMGAWGTGLFATSLLLASIVLLFQVHPLEVGRVLKAFFQRQVERWQERRQSRMDREEALAEEQKELEKKRRKLEKLAAEAAAPLPPKVRVRAKGELPPDPMAEPTTVKSRARLPDPEPEPATVVVEAPAPADPSTLPAEDPEPEPVAAETVVPVEAPVRPVAPPPEPAPARPRPTTARQAETVIPVVPEQAGYPDYVLPELALLDELPPPEQRQMPGDSADTTLGARVLKDTMAEFGVEVEITNVERGPVVTRFELLPAAGVRVEKITSLSNNIALAMKAESVRIQAPIPGKGVVGIEVPNPKTTAIYLREILESDAWQDSKAALPLALGHDVGGRVLIADLADMPHLLIAGATGAGKSVCMNSILAGLLMSRTPDQMRLILVDPKIVEFSCYNQLPHLVVPVITDSKKVTLGLRWAINEMERRYKLFAKVGVRNIKAFNNRPIVKQEELFSAESSDPPPPPEEKIPDRVPYIVIIVDELADLMLVAQAEIENQIARLAQLSRAVGIHMILATQRPSVNVITGTIKANFPARISFQVAQKVDSRTILDAPGADKLLGKGDMLFLTPRSPNLVRAQGTLTTDAEIQRVVDHIKKQGVPQYEMAVKDKIEGRSVDLPDMEEDDELLEQSLTVIRETRRASTSALQRRLRIGYTRAARIMDLLEQRGVVGPANGSDPREILIDLDGEVPDNNEPPTA